MKRLQIFREYEDGFVLINVRQFMAVGINAEGEYDLAYSPLPDAVSVIERLESANLTLGNFNSLRYFKREHLREFMLNRVYALSASRRSLCWLDASGHEAYPDARFNCGFHRSLLWKRHFEQMAAAPVGYTGELCILAIREGHENMLAYRPKRTASHYIAVNGFNGEEIGA